MEIGVFAYVKVITLPVIYSLTCVPRIYSCRSIMVLVQCTYHGSSSIWIPINYSTMYQCIMTHDLYVYLSYSHELIMSCILYHLLMDISWSIILIMYLWIYLDLYSYHVLMNISWFVKHELLLDVIFFVSNIIYLLQILVEAGAEINKRQPDNHTPLTLACQNGYVGRSNK